MNCPCEHVDFEKGYSLKGYLGLTRLNSQGEQVVITEEEFRDFVKTHISTTFPEGFTIYMATGGYSYNGESYIEPTNVLEVVLPKEGRHESILKFKELINLYSKLFNQSGEFITMTSTGFYAK
jgi:hypothetical protein